MYSIFCRVALCVALTSGAISGAHAADLIAQTGSVFLHADEGSYLGYSISSTSQTLTHGVNGVFHSNLIGTYDPYITVSADDRWSFMFEAPRENNPANPSGRVPLKVGFYDNAVRYPFNPDGVAGMDISVNASGYGSLSGWFNVLEVAYDANFQVTVLAVDFAEYGETASKTGPGVFGSLRFNSAIPLTTSVPELNTLAQLCFGVLGVGAVVRRNKLRP